MSTFKPIISMICCCVIGAMVFTSGCGKTSRTRKVEKTGFMTDYSILKRTKGDRAQLLYVNYQADWKQYDSIYLEPITSPRIPLHPAWGFRDGTAGSSSTLRE